MLNSIGSGLLSNLTPDTSVPDWAGYQSLVGFGRGAATPVVSPFPNYPSMEKTPGI